MSNLKVRLHGDVEPGGSTYTRGSHALCTDTIVHRAGCCPGRRRGRAAPDRAGTGSAGHARTVLRVPDRHRQQARAMGQDRRVHEAGVAARAIASASANSGKTTDGNPFIVTGDQRARHAEEPRPLQAGSSASSISRAARRPTPSATRSSPRGSWSLLVDLQHSRDRDRRLADGGGAGAPPRHRELAAGEEDPRQRDLPAGAEPQSRRPDHGDRLVQQEPRHAVRDEPAFPYLYHPYVGHDNNRDMYMFTQKESQHTAQAAVARLVPLGVARRAPDGQQRPPASS